MIKAVNKVASNGVISVTEKKRVVGRPFQKGQVTNPAGRPKGSRNKLQEYFVRELCADFELHGAESVVKLRQTDVATYMKVIAQILPKQVEIGEAGAFTTMSDDELKAFLNSTLLTLQITTDYETIQ